MGDCPIGQIDFSMGHVMGGCCLSGLRTQEAWWWRGDAADLALVTVQAESWAPMMFTSQFLGPVNGTFYGKRGNIPLYGKICDEVKDVGVEGLS